MICSHKHRFVFIKTTKTAGTSIEMSLAKHCGPEDIVTPIWGDGRETPETVMEREGTHYRKTLREHDLRDWFSLATRGRRQIKYRNHEPASTAKAKLGERLWDAYLTFAVVRNPWDRTVSIYDCATGNIDPAERPTLFDWICANPATINATWRLCAEDDRLLIEEVVRYESLREDLGRVCDRIGLPGNIHDDMTKASLKTSQRPKDADYRSVVDDRSRELIGLLCKHEIETFGYAF